MSAHTRVVVTGIGATTPVGGTATETWQGLLAGESGARPLPQEWLDRYELPVTFAANLKQPPGEVLKKVETRRMDPFSQYAMIAAREAWADAGEPDIEPERLLAAIGTGIGGVHSLLDQYDVLKEKGPRRVYPLTVPMLMPNAASGMVSLEFKARAGAHTAVSACASGAESMGMAADMIRAGRADIAIAGGSEAAIHPLPIAGFAAAQALSRRNDDPTAASRPWATDRDGFLLAEGAAVMILESYEHAVARGAKIYAEFASIGMSADAYHITAGDPEGVGQARAMNEAIDFAGLTPRDIVHINAHATSTPVGDQAEAVSIRRAFGDAVDGVCLTGTKSMTGHLLGAAGALEALITVLSIKERIVPATINTTEVDPSIDLDLVLGKHRALPEGDIAAMSNAFGFGGHNIAIVIKSV
ncbi:beta-ketoacyl-ACP synthase II [Rudaeicoccus suwonensis]|uniref:3-oxoacyl-[acyl-carrier-protein] synthase 2 n=1 Tax=Rudaeicoccus suwonensis TaxID=657409 RepID=A0A561E9V7_9MICO|nr:beta-ketoacyl-ACP synthase II [Rudaeicoccus suwonensis]TWE12398.1 3-oxoacyl-[acyl-carrier-protein] synthase II [Rudaeicoccus suwonensis]